MKDSFQLKRLGDTYVELGDLESAELLYRKALSIDEVLVPDTIPLAEDLYNLGLVCYALENYLEATNFLLRAWKIERRLLGDMHMETLNTFNLLSEIHSEEEARENEPRLYAPARATMASHHVYH